MTSHNDRVSGDRMVTCGICRAKHPARLTTMRPLKRRTRRSPYMKPVCPCCEAKGWLTCERAAHTHTLNSCVEEDHLLSDPKPAA